MDVILTILVSAALLASVEAMPTVRNLEFFTGEDGVGVMDWTYALVAHIALMMAIDPEHFNAAAHQVLFGIAHLRGTAQDWAMGRMAAGIPWADLQQFVTALREDFLGAVVVQNSRTQLRRLKQAQFHDLGKYVEAFRKLLRKIPNMADVEARDVFVEGLYSNYFAEVDRAHPQTLEQAISEAQQAELRFQRTREHSRAAQSRVGRGGGWVEPENQPEPMELGAVEAELSAMSMRDKCWLCYKPGHYHEDCPNTNQVYCQLCFGQGHEALKCHAYTVQPAVKGRKSKGK